MPIALINTIPFFFFFKGMDSVTRQVIQHMEFEPVWEAAFQLHIKLSLVITLIIKWCGSDKVVLIKAFRATLNKLNECKLEGTQTNEVRELADHSATCIQFDVATQPVSIHLPLSRFLAGLYLHLGKYNLTFNSPEFQATVKPSPEQIIEPILRTQVKKNYVKMFFKFCKFKYYVLLCEKKFTFAQFNLGYDCSSAFCYVEKKWLLSVKSIISLS